MVSANYAIYIVSKGRKIIYFGFMLFLVLCLLALRLARILKFILSNAFNTFCLYATPLFKSNPRPNFNPRQILSHKQKANFKVLILLKPTNQLLFKNKSRKPRATPL